jgi:predicted nucleotidyltransferase
MTNLSLLPHDRVTIQEFVTRVRQRVTAVAEMRLFRSKAKQSDDRDSDIDVLVVLASPPYLREAVLAEAVPL